MDMDSVKKLLGFEQTSDLVRFVVRAPSEVTGMLIEVASRESSAERPWFLVRIARIGHSDTSEAEFFVSKDSTPKILDILSKHGIQRVPLRRE